MRQSYFVVDKYAEVVVISDADDKELILSGSPRRLSIGEGVAQTPNFKDNESRLWSLRRKNMKRPKQHRIFQEILKSQMLPSARKSDVW